MKWLLPLAISVCAFGQTAAELQRQAAEKQRAAAEVQRQAVEKNAEAPFPAPPPAAKPAVESAAPAAKAPQDSAAAAGDSCEPLAETVIGPLVEGAAKANELEPRLLRAVMERESGFRPCAVSPKGARGLMQLMPATATQFSVKDPLDPAQNVTAGAKYLKQLLDRFEGDVKLALGAFNAGPAAVEQAGGVPDFAETRDYVDAIMEKAGVKQRAPPSSPTPKPIEN